MYAIRSYYDLEAGTYDQIRMHVTDSKVVMNDDTEFDLKVPSGSSSGLKIKIEPALEISSGQTADVLLDFDVSKSFVAKGNMENGHFNGFNFKPVVRCVMLGRAGRIEGTIIDTANVAIENASVNRITSYNVCYTKLLRFYTLSNFERTKVSFFDSLMK